MRTSNIEHSTFNILESFDTDSDSDPDTDEKQRGKPEPREP